MEKESRCILSLGTNTNRERNRYLAEEQLCLLFEEIVFSEPLLTLPHGDIETKEYFLNQVAIGYTSYKKEDIIVLLKKIEQQLGRRREDKAKGIVVIDLDLLQWEEEMLKPQDMERDYVQEALRSLRATGDKDEGRNNKTSISGQTNKPV